MHGVVMHDLLRMKHAGQFVWLALEYDPPENEPIIKKYSADNIPVLVVADARSETAQARWLGTATAAQVDHFLGSVAAGSHGDAAAQAMADGDRAMAKPDNAAAALAYRRAVASSPPDKPEHAAAVVALLTALEESDQSEECARTFVKEAPRLHGAELGSAAFFGAVCASAKPDAPWVKALAPDLERLAAPALTVPMAFDQRVTVYNLLADLHKQRGDEAGAKALHQEPLRRLTEEWQHTRSPAERVGLIAFWPYAATSAGVPERAVAPLEACERESPNEYQASLQLARAYIGLNRLDDAQAATERGMKKAVGPESRFWIAAAQTRILIKRGDVEGARRRFTAAVADVPANTSDRVRNGMAFLRNELKLPAPPPATPAH